MATEKSHLVSVDNFFSTVSAASSDRMALISWKFVTGRESRNEVELAAACMQRAEEFKGRAKATALIHMYKMMKHCPILSPGCVATAIAEARKERESTLLLSCHCDFTDGRIND